VFSKYYQSELTYLRDMGQTFGTANPAIAGLLAERGADPDVERLLEGFAFLTARVRERMDDAIPEIVHLLSELLVPHFLRPIPATSVVEFTPQIGSLRGRHLVARGTPVASIPLQGTACAFRTTADVELVPVVLENVHLDESSARNPRLRLQLSAPEKALPSVFEPGGLRLHLSSDYGIASTLLLWFLRHCAEVHVGPRGMREGKRVLPPSAVRPVGFSPNEAMLPWPGFSPPAFRLLQEYYTLPAKFLFVDIKGLDAAQEAAAEEFDILFVFDRPPELSAPIGRQSIRLHCAPVINLFNAPAIPIKRSAIEHEQILRPSDVDPAHAEVYSVDSVTGVRSGSGDRINYVPFIDFRHVAASRSDTGYYQLRRCSSPLDGGVDTYFAITTPSSVRVELPPVEETFSIELTCTNRFLAGELASGDICEPIAGSPAVATFKNITEVTQPVVPPLGGELHWRLLAHLSLTHGSLAKAENLQALLGLYNFQELAEHAVGRANRLRVESVHGVELQASRRILGGTSVRGARTCIEVTEDKLAGIGDAFLFGCILDELLGEHVSINSYHQLVLRLLPSQREHEWPARAGMKPIV
jgi:type VI secretion system protein ImpG